MIVTPERSKSLLESFKELESLLKTYGPPSLHELRLNGVQQFETLGGIPTTKDEEWKYTSLRKLQEMELIPAYGATVDHDDFEALPLANIKSARISFINGEYAPEYSFVQNLPEGVVVSTLKDAMESHEELVLKHLAKYANADDEQKLGSTNQMPFIALNNAFLAEGVFVYIPKGVVVEELIHFYFVSRADHGAFAAHPRVLIVAEEAAQAKVLETYVGIEGVYFTNVVTEAYLGKGAIVEHIKVQQESPEAIHIATIQAEQEEDSTWTSNNASFGGAIARNDINVYLDGEHTETWLNGTYVGMGEQIVDNHTRIDHAKPNCNSFEVYKGILGGKSTGVFNGKIFVYEDAQKTDAKQTNQALLLSKTATIDTKPQLEIFADDVKCTHGATVGQLREDAMFYLRARGIPFESARALLTYAFASEVLEKISIEELKNAVEEMLFAKLKENKELAEAL